MNNNFMWANLVHLGSNMWTEPGNRRTREHRSNAEAYDHLRFDRKIWDDYMVYMKNNGVNTVVIDLGEAMIFDSHPELAVEGSWTHDQMREEIDRLNKMGFEVIPKLNFSACHDIWLKDYSRMLSTPIYYQVCKDVINEVCEVFKPKYFHLGMDEETAQHQGHFLYAVVRQFELWWHDFYYLVDCVENNGSRAWIWSDYIWNHQNEFVKKMPKSVVQSNWYYSPKFENLEAAAEARLRATDVMDKYGYDQIPTGSVFTDNSNFEKLTKYSVEKIAPERHLGMLQTSWEHLSREWLPTNYEAVDRIAAAKAWYEENVK